jgi:DNA polymerase III sliding clamp (beta) subunit (PCNA family)
MASADGSRLVYLNDKRLTFGLGNLQAIIPLDTILIIPKLFRKVEVIEVAFHSNQETWTGVTKTVPDIVYFKSADTLLISHVTQGTYPKYEQLIPKDFICKVSFSAPLLMQRLQMIDTKTLTSGIVKSDFHIKETGEHECYISSQYSEGDYKYALTMPVKIETPEGARIAFNYKYIIDAIKPFSMCNLELTSPSSPGKFTGDIEGLTIVVMPIFMQW